MDFWDCSRTDWWMDKMTASAKSKIYFLPHCILQNVSHFFKKVFAVVLFINFQHFYALQRYKHSLTILIYLLWKQSCVFTSRSSSPGTAKIVLRFVIQRCGRQYITAVTHQATAKVHGTFLWNAFSCCKLLTIITWISGCWPRDWFILLKCAGGKYLSAHSVTLLVGGDFLIKLC